MVDETRSPGTLKCGAARRFSISVLLSVFAVAIAAWLISPDFGPGFGSRALAAPVDAVGVPAPVGFAGIVAKVKPAVVGIRVMEKTPSSSNQTQQLPFSPSSPFNRLFRHFGIPTPNTPAPEYAMALGSGFFVSADGYVVTNNHVVKNGKSFTVTTSDGKTYPAKVVGTDPLTDLALLKVAGHDFPYVKFASQEPRVGDWVLAVGNPFGLGGTVTAGIVSARGRDIGASTYDDFIQIDAPVNKGNSGGPSFNVQGEVIGVNTSILTPSGGFVGVAFDIPAATVKMVIQQLEKTGHVTRGWIGVQVQEVTPSISAALGLKKPGGALVAEVEPNGPAAKTGIKSGDVITTVNGHAVSDPRGLAQTIAAIAPGTSVKVGLVRNGTEKTFDVKLGELPSKLTQAAQTEPPNAPSQEPTLGLTLAPANTVPGAGSEGVVITAVNPNGRAAQSGLQDGDVILDMNNTPVNSPAEVSKVLKEAHAQSKRAVLLRIRRGKQTSFAAVRIG